MAKKIMICVILVLGIVSIASGRTAFLCGGESSVVALPGSVIRVDLYSDEAVGCLVFENISDTAAVTGKASNPVLHPGFDNPVFTLPGVLLNSDGVLIRNMTAIKAFGSPKVSGILYSFDYTVPDVSCCTPWTIGPGEGTNAVSSNVVPQALEVTAGTIPTDSDGDDVLDDWDNCPDEANGEQEDGDGDGVGDVCDNCPADGNADQNDLDGDGLGDACDDDIDGDGVPNGEDNCPLVNNPGQENSDEDGVPDTDGDGVDDCLDSCPDDPGKTEPGICGCGVGDSDGDGLEDCEEQCPDDRYKTEAGICGCGVRDTDSDDDGAVDCMDDCPNDPDKVEPGICGCGVPDRDVDADGFVCDDNCPYDSNPEQGDGDGDGVGDVCDNCPDCPILPAGAGGRGDAFDCPCPGDLNADGQVDLQDLDAMVNLLLSAGPPGFIPPAVAVGPYHCGDMASPYGQIGLQDLDAMVQLLVNAGPPFIVPCPGMEDHDNDGIPARDDNCPDDYNPGQEDSDGDGVGDVCDNCPNSNNENQADGDEDGVGDVCDNCANDFNPAQADADGNGVGDACEGCPWPGDITEPSGQVDLQDLDAMVNLLVAAGPPFIVPCESVRCWCADMAEPIGQVDLQDLDALVHVLLTNLIPVLKPNIYLYPEETIELDVEIVFPHGGQVTDSIPDYGNGWQVTVEPSGIIDAQYQFLFYEASVPDWGQYSAGWVVAVEELEDFFTNNMAQTGFNQKEIDDFIEYWIPRLVEYPFYAIYPQYKEELEDMIRLEFSTQPASVIRLIYSVRGLEKNTLGIREPVIPAFEREGFTVTEWGVIRK